LGKWKGKRGRRGKKEERREWVGGSVSHAY